MYTFVNECTQLEVFIVSDYANFAILNDLKLLQTVLSSFWLPAQSVELHAGASSPSN